MIKTFSNVKLNSGFKMPDFGFGCFNGPQIEEAVYTAIRTGYRYIDTSAYLKNEDKVGKAIGRALSDGICKREDLFILTKLCKYKRSSALESMKESVAKLNLDYVDLYLIHWANPTKSSDGWDFSTPNYKIWQELEKGVELGISKSIGVSNFGTQALLDLLCSAKIRPAVNEIECSPYFNNFELKKVLDEFDIRMIGYYSLGTGRKTLDGRTVLEDPVLHEIAKKYENTVSQVIYSWLRARNVTGLATTRKEERIVENFESIGLEMEEEDLLRIDALDCGFRVCDKFDYFGGLSIHV